MTEFHTAPVIKHAFLLVLMSLLWEKSAKAQSSPQAVALAKEMPSCSLLRRQLERGETGDGVEQPYMEHMRQLGVRRAVFYLRARRHGSGAKNVELTRKMFFSQYDAADSQISDDGDLHRIQESGLMS